MSVHYPQLCSMSVHLILSFSTKGLLFHLILISFWEYTQPFSCASCPLYEDSVFRSISRELDQGLAVGISEHSWSQLTSFGLFLLSEGKKILPGVLKSETESNDSVAKQYQNLPYQNSPMICRQLHSCWNRAGGGSARNLFERAFKL